MGGMEDRRESMFKGMAVLRIKGACALEDERVMSVIIMGKTKTLRNETSWHLGEMSENMDEIADVNVKVGSVTDDPVCFHDNRLRMVLQCRWITIRTNSCIAVLELVNCTLREFVYFGIWIKRTFSWNIS